MPTLLSQQELIKEKTVVELGYCKEKPKTVLGRLLPNHLILSYNSLWLGGLVPKERFEEDRSRHERVTSFDYTGFVINEGHPPYGTTVTGTLSGLLKGYGLNEKRNIFRLDAKRTEEDVRSALKRVYEEVLPSDYLETREKEQIDVHEYKLTQLTDIISVCFKIKKPTIDDVKRILIGK